MDQIANLVIDLGIDAAEFKNEIPRIKNLLNGAASDAERSSARMQRFMERQTQAARQTTQAASSAATAASVHAQTVEKNAQAHERMAREGGENPPAHGGTEPENARGTGAGHGSGGGSG
ncbi:Phage tail length tape-measure protein 1 [Escherichia coli EC4100B]|nr:Phage tail length tape-measure protein 1 [Escherichia coli EC4100B]